MARPCSSPDDFNFVAGERLRVLTEAKSFEPLRDVVGHSASLQETGFAQALKDLLRTFFEHRTERPIHYSCRVEFGLLGRDDRELPLRLAASLLWTRSSATGLSRTRIGGEILCDGGE